MTSVSEQYSTLTIDITASLTKAEKKADGIFITPRVIIKKLFDEIALVIDQTQLIKPYKILEPSCGTCEIVNYCDEQFSKPEIHAIEKNSKLFTGISGLKFKHPVKLFNQDFLDYEPETLYHLIVTNPPYYVCKKNDIPKKYHEYIHGRPNIFAIFIIHSISMICPGGLLAFIVPISFLNSIYYHKIRNYIKASCDVLKIIDFTKDNKFIDTEQGTFGIILKRKSDTSCPVDCEFSMKISDNFVFTHNSLQLRAIFEGATSIAKMGLKVRTGSVVWNEHKDILTMNDQSTKLIYNSNITKQNTIEMKQFKNTEKFQYINMDGRHQPILVVNRGNGNSKYKLNYAFIESGPYLIENHLNEIYDPTGKGKELYEKIINSFKNPKTQLFIDMYLGNNGLSKTELETIFPIYL
jgi:adenine-specific DNA-methyltransferase